MEPGTHTRLPAHSAPAFVHYRLVCPCDILQQDWQSKATMEVHASCRLVQKEIHRLDPLHFATPLLKEASVGGLNLHLH